MNETARLTPERIENLAIEIREFLLEHEMWVDVDIYFNGKCFTTYDKATGKFYYNDREHLVVRENEDPRTYFEYVNPDHILSTLFPIFLPSKGVNLGASLFRLHPRFLHQFPDTLRISSLASSNPRWVYVFSVTPISLCPMIY